MSIESYASLKELRKAVKDRKVTNLENLSPAMQKRLARVPSKYSKGIANTKLVEPLPNFIKSKAEKVIKGQNNTYIVLGRDRPRSIFSGYGSLGHTGCGTIDIVVGRMGPNARSESDDGKDLFCDPDFELDAARIYISQKTNVDENFELDGRPFVPDASERSTIALKADGIRVVGRENVKIMVAPDLMNSQGGKQQSIGGIYLVAGPADEDGDRVQPIAKALSVAACLQGVMDEVENLRAQVAALLEKQMSFNSNLANHVHASPFFGKPTLASVVLQGTGQQTNSYLTDNTMMSLVNVGSNLKALRQTFLDPSNANYVGSRHNKTN